MAEGVLRQSKKGGDASSTGTHRGFDRIEHQISLKRRGKRMKKACVFFMMFAAFGFMFSNAAVAAESQPKVYKLGFLSGLSGPLAQAAETQRKAVVLFVDQINAQGGLKMPWGKVPVELIVKDDEMKLDVGVRRFRELVEAGCLAVTGTIYNPMSGALNEECKITGTVYMPGCVLPWTLSRKAIRPLPPILSRSRPGALAISWEMPLSKDWGKRRFSGKGDLIPGVPSCLRA
jgi:hypothetical protein